MKTMYITIGISASGKSTWAKQKAKDIGAVEINCDDIRFNKVMPLSNWSTYKFNTDNELKVSECANDMFSKANFNNRDVIISDTNLNTKFRNKWITLGESHGYKIEIVEFPIDYNEAVKRDKLRLNSVGENVIYQQLLQWNKYKGRKTYTRKDGALNAVIIDIDGTIADKGNRYVFDYSNVINDSPKQEVIDMIGALVSKYNAVPIFLTGRPEKCRADTENWINTHSNLNTDHYLLFMRKDGDFSKDIKHKEEVFWNHIDGRYNIIAAFEDRPVVVKLWHELELPNVITVSNPYLDF